MTGPRQRYDLLKGRLNRFSKQMHGVESGDVQAIHGTRVASRRLRELLPVLQLKADSADKLGRQLRRVTKRLGELRELDVTLQLLEKLQTQGRPGATALQMVIESVRRERDEAYRHPSSKPFDATLERLDRQLHKIADDLKGADKRRAARRWMWALDARVVRRAFMLRRTIERAGAMYWPKRLHQARLATKKLRYGLELLVEASPPVSTKPMEEPESHEKADLLALRRGQDLLGRLHDLQVVSDRVREVQAACEPTNVAISHEFDALAASLEDDSRRLHARYVRSRSVLLAICDRLAAPSAEAKRTAIRRAS